MTFSMSSPVQRRAWELLCMLPKGKRTHEICRALCNSYDGFALEDIRSVVREELKSVSITKNNNTEEMKDEEIGDGFLDFLSSLDEGSG